jgi:hypothetical protein
LVNEHENLFIVATPAAPLRPTAVGSWSDTPLTQGLSIVPASRDSERAWANFCRACPALHSGRGWRFVAPGYIFERDEKSQVLEIVWHK